MNPTDPGPLILWLSALLGPPLALFLLGRSRLVTGRLRLLSLLGATASCTSAALPLLVPQLRGWQLGGDDTGTAWLRLDGLSLILPLLATSLWLFTVLVTPRVELDRAALRRTALSTGFILVGFLTEHPLLLWTSWTASVLTLLSAQPHRRRGEPRVDLSAHYLLATVLAFGAGLLLLHLAPSTSSTQADLGLLLVIAAALVRKGILPFHAWVPALFERERLGPAIMFCAPQMGTYAVAVVVVPRASPSVLSAIAIMSLITAVYAAAMALVQRSARRACAYLFTSQSALVMAGLDSTGHEGLTGALVLWVSSSLAFAALARAVLVLEARRGPFDLERHHGRYDEAPFIATCFLVLGLTLTGFPGTLGFVGEELLLAGAVAEFPVIGYLVVLSSALTGLSVLRMYFSIFTGTRPGDLTPMRRRPRELIGFGGVVGTLLLLGLAPRALVDDRMAASAQILASRHADATSPASDPPLRGP